ncbi:hypothetical protein C8F01DRAFT_1267834 [Mycena amicta]|nr:hypothetical protein C8F01DRAFT_1267834 [Mycena amicta]
MSTPNRKFAFFGPYITTPNARELRARIIEPHQAALRKLTERGILKLGGPTYNDDGAGEDSPDRPFGGTFFLLEAASRAEILEIIQNDLYYTEGLWDVPNIRLSEYHPLTPYPF